MIELWESLLPEIQGALLVLAGTLITAILHAWQTNVAAREKRVGEIRSLVRDCAIHATTMVQQTYQTTEMLQKQDERSLHIDQIHAVMASANEGRRLLLQQTMALINCSDSRMSAAGNAILDAANDYSHKYTFLGVDGEGVDLVQMRSDGTRVLDIVSIVSNMVTSRWWERIYRFRSPSRATRIFMNQRKNNNNRADALAEHENLTEEEYGRPSD